MALSSNKNRGKKMASVHGSPNAYAFPASCLAELVMAVGWFLGSGSDSGECADFARTVGQHRNKLAFGAL